MSAESAFDGDGFSDREEVRRDDGELEGFVVRVEDGLVPVTVFGCPLGPACDEDEAREVVQGRGLAVLAERWEWERDGELRPVVIAEVSASHVVVTDPYAGVVGADAQRWTLSAEEARRELRLRG